MDDKANMPANDWDAELVDAAMSNDAARVRVALEAGADPNALMPRYETPVLFAVTIHPATDARNEVLELLLNYGADPHARDKAGDTLIHSAALHNMRGVVQQMMEAGVDPLARNKRGNTAHEQMGNYTAQGVAELLRRARTAPRVTLDEKLTHDALFAPDELGDAPIDNSLTWHCFDELVAQLEKNGQPPLTKDDLMRTDKTGMPYLGRAILCYQWETVQNYLSARGEAVDHHDLAAPEQKGEFITAALMRRGRLPEFFDVTYWQDKPQSELRQTYEALSDEAKAAMPFFQISAHKRQQEALQQAPERGR
jgi:hypothetical protein